MARHSLPSGFTAGAFANCRVQPVNTRMAMVATNSRVNSRCRATPRQLSPCRRMHSIKYVRMRR